MKLPTKYKKDIKLIYVKPYGFDIRCEYRCKKSNKPIDYWIRINKDIKFYSQGKDKQHFVDCLLFEYSYDYSASIADVLAIDYIDCYYDNNSDYDNKNNIRHESVIVRSGQLRLYGHKLSYPGFNQREIYGAFRYWNSNGNKMPNDDFCAVLDYEVAK